MTIPGGADAAAVERAVTRLGYKVTRVAVQTAPRLILPGENETSCGCGGGVAPVPAPAPASSRVPGAKGRLVLLSGAALALGWGGALLLPDLARGFLSLACLVGLIPVARKAFALVRSGPALHHRDADDDRRPCPLCQESCRGASI